MTAYINPWTAARIKYLTVQWKAGLSAGQIALQMEGGFSRSSIIGKVHRLGLGGRGQPHKRLPKGPRRIARVTGPRQKSEFYARSYTPPKEKYPLLEAPKKLAEPESLKLSILDLSDTTCKYPGDEDRAPFTYCGNLAVESRPYCAFHEQVAHTKGTQRDFDRIASRTMGGFTGLGKAVVEA